MRANESGLFEIEEKVLAGERLSFDDGMLLFECEDLATLGRLANIVRRRRHGREPSMERAVKNFFMGLAFIFVAFAARAWAPAGNIWWFWMFIPAASMIADGVSTYIRIAENKKKLAPPPYVPAQAAVPPPPRASALPPRNTGEIVPPPSITEGTTRHLNVPADRTRNDT